jgi:hypothetical protein
MDHMNTHKSMPKQYSGSRKSNLDSDTIVTVSMKGKFKILSPKRSLKVRRHSPTGFNWSYGGSGPAQLALAILLDLYPDRGTQWAESIYQEFKFKVIAQLSDSWTLTSEEIDRAVQMIERET